MADTKLYIETLFNARGITVSAHNKNRFEEYVAEAESIESVNTITENQNRLMDKWKIIARVADIKAQQIIIPNATIGKPYKTRIDFEKLKLTDLISERFEGLAEIGLAYNAATDSIEGTPLQSGDLKIKFFFKVDGESELAPENEKQISLVVNPDPKTLWKNLPSDKNDPFWKEDNVAVSGSLGDRNIVVSSKRGRSHQNVGSFRDDDFAFKYLEQTGWSVVTVSDGAGSYSLSRKGSQIACEEVVRFFEEHDDLEKSAEFEAKIAEYAVAEDEAVLKEIEILGKHKLYRATVYVHNKIKEHAEATKLSNPELFTNPKAKTALDYYHATLIFSLYKKYSFGYIILTFGVGDCPVAVMNKDKTQTVLLDWLDVGEFGGGTRFITQPDIFHSTEHPMASRFSVKAVRDFSFLFLMSDGIYDPKFVVEANLEKHDKWLEFVNDLNGQNDDNAAVDFNPENADIAEQLSTWMDFWSPGNHDDRTLAIVF